MGVKLKERMEDLVCRLHPHLSAFAASLQQADKLPVSEEYELGVPMQSLMVGRRHHAHRDEQLLLALNEAFEESGFAAYPPLRGDAPYAFAYTEESRVDTGRLGTKKEVVFRINTNNPAMLAEQFDQIGQRAIEIAQDMPGFRKHGGEGHTGFSL